MNQGGRSKIDPVNEATPKWVLCTSLGISWGGAAATALLFVVLGTSLDQGEIATARLFQLVALGVVAVGCAAAGPLFSVWAESETETRLRRSVISRVYSRGIGNPTERSGNVLSLATGAVERAAHYRAGFLGPIMGALSIPLLVLAIMALLIDPVTAGWLALLVLLVPILIGGFRRLARPIGASYRKAQGQLTAAFLEAIQAMDTLIYARAAERIGVDLAQRGEEHRRRLMRLLAGNQLLIFVVDAGFSLTVLVAAAGLSVSRVASGQLTLGQALAIVLMTTLVIGPVDVVGQFFYVGIGGRAAQRSLRQYIAGDDHPPVAAAEMRPNAEPGDAGVELDDVSVGWPGGPLLFEGLSFRVEAGERVALVGPSGIGKSTISALIQAHLMPAAGRVLVDGLDISRTDPALVRSRLTVVEQRTFLFLGTIADNLRIVAPDADEQRLWKVLELAGLADEVAAMPAGLATQVGQHGNALSGGQAQRLAIARAWLRDAPILLLDEPTSQVDLAAEAAIREALLQLAEGRTVLMISHRPGTIMAADRVIDLAEQVVVA